jgi:RNA polymerase sigma factor (sigma-70 family)
VPQRKDADASLGPIMTAERIYLENLDTIERIARFVAYRNHLNADEAGDFTQEVQLRLIDGDYAIIRKFESRSKFSTFLTTVIPRLFQQWRTEQWGKWRPSAEARRLGDKAITLERLLTRDGYTLEEAVNVLTTPGSSQYSRAELESIYLRLPLRSPRPILVSDEAAPDVIAVGADADDRVEMHARERSARDVCAAVDRLVQSMDADDQLILKLRFWQALKVPEIAQRLQLDQKKIYKRLDRLFLMMRRALEEAGVDKSEIGTLLCSGDQEIRFAFPYPSGENGRFGPSHDAGGEARGSEGGLR